MNVATITMKRSDAKEQAAQYRESVRRQSQRQKLSEEESRLLQEDRHTLKALRSLARGEKIVNLYDTMRAAGCNGDGSPLFAFSRATWKFCWCERVCHKGEQVQFRGKERLYRDTGYWWENIPAGCLPGYDSPIQSRSRCAWRAVVPQVPPRHRPRGSLRRYFILWEADWHAVPVDPMLLRHISGPLYAVLAVWDLTEIERSILGLRLG